MTTAPERCHSDDDMSQMVVISVADYDRLLMAAEADDMLTWCETCGAWLDRDDAACAHTEDYIGCWKVATRREQDVALCRSYRASDYVNNLRGRREMERKIAQERLANTGETDG